MARQQQRDLAVIGQELPRDGMEVVVPGRLLDRIAPLHLGQLIGCPAAGALVDLGQVPDGDERGPTACAAAQDEAAAHDPAGRQAIDAVPKIARGDAFPGELQHSSEGQVAFADPVEEDNALAVWVCV